MESSANKKLTRGSTFIAGGVCAGLAKYYCLNKGGRASLFSDWQFVFWFCHSSIFSLVGYFAKRKPLIS